MQERPLWKAVAAAVAVLASWPSAQDPLPEVGAVDVQPLVAATKRLVEALSYVGAPLTAADRKRLEAVFDQDVATVRREIGAVLDARCLAFVHINPESRVKVRAGPARPALVQHGWRTFLVKVHNEAGVTAPLRVSSPQAEPMHKPSTGSPAPTASISPGALRDRFLEARLYARRPLHQRLSGLALEYRVLQLYSRDAGRREAQLAFDVGQGTQDLGFRNQVTFLFDCARAVQVVLDVKDHDGAPAMGSFVIRDWLGRVYPAPARRLAPDFFFHHQIYRKSGESVLLPPGRFVVEYGRGPEYVVKRREIEVPDRARHEETFRLERWIDTAARGWWSGDHHIHAAGCAHYESPSEGVRPEDMMRHVLGEDLKVGCVLSWGPCWYYQKQFFDGKVHEVSTRRYVLRYDVEVSGFPSSHCGHLSLLRLQEDDYPGTTRIEEWPSWDLPVLEWAKRQGAVAGFSHSGWGLRVRGRELPNYRMPPFDGIGANEYIVDVTHDAVDFISTVDTPAVWELNIWYHTLNCGFRTRISGETDFPCIYGERVGLGRSYVRLPEAAELDYDAWVHGIRDGRSYVSDGKSHLLNFKAGGVPVGEPGPGGAVSELALETPGKIRVTAMAAAWLDEEPNRGMQGRPLDKKPYWDVERARVGTSRRVAVELVRNGRSVARKLIEADGQVRPVEFEVDIERSSWLGLRIFPSSHTNPVFVLVGDKPIRASRRSAKWCLEAVDVCWKAKVGRIRQKERKAAAAAYEVARQRYRRILGECEID